MNIGDFVFFRRNRKKPRWITLPSDLECFMIPFVSDEYIKDGDVVITTWWASALELQKLSVSKGRRVNLIQGYENWLGHENLLHQSYNIKDGINIVIASYLYKIVSSYTSNITEIVNNSVNLSEFFIKVESINRNPYSISMMYSTQELKGSLYGLKALNMLKKKYPNLEVNIFSVRSKPKNLPAWMNYYKNPSNLCDIYNSSSIFISTSIQEGWGLTPMEAMASGCACVATEIDGHTEYLKNEYNCLFCVPEDEISIVDKVSLLIENSVMRIDIVKNGMETVNRYHWCNAVSKFESILNRAIL